MAENQNDGGQAFPQPMTVGPNDDLYPAYPGMTLRDWLGGQALPSTIIVCKQDNYNNTAFKSYAAYCAAKSYEMADAMLAARSPHPSDE